MLVIASVIFTASSQPYDQQDLRPQLAKVTDVDRMKGMYTQLKRAHLEQKLMIQELGVPKTLRLLVDKGNIVVRTLGIFFVMLFVTLLFFSVRLVRKRGVKWAVRAFPYLAFLLGVSILLVFLGMLFVFRMELFIGYLKDQLDVARMKELLHGVQLTYAGHEISMERSGVAGFLEFFIRKGAHFVLFFLLGFFLCRALLVSGWKKWSSVVGAFSFVVLYAILDEIHQAFTPNRTPLVQDVILDSAGGLTGIFTALLLYSIIKWYKGKRRPAASSVVESRTRRYQRHG